MSVMDPDQRSEDEPSAVVDQVVWDAAAAEVESRNRRSTRARWIVWMVAIVVSWVAMLATFVGLPLVAATSVLLVMMGSATVFAHGGARWVLSRETPHLDEVRSIVRDAFGVEADREEASRLVGVGGTFVALSRVSASQETEGVVLRREVLDPSEGPWWGFPSSFTS